MGIQWWLLEVKGLVPHWRLVRHWKLGSNWSWWIHETTGRKQAAAPFELTVVDESEMDELHGWNGVANWILRFPFCSCSSDLFTLLFTMFSTVADSPPRDCSFCCVFLALISAPVVFDIRHTFFPGRVIPLWSPVLTHILISFLSHSDCSLIADCPAVTVLETVKALLWLGRLFKYPLTILSISLNSSSIPSSSSAMALSLDESSTVSY